MRRWEAHWHLTWEELRIGLGKRRKNRSSYSISGMNTHVRSQSHINSWASGFTELGKWRTPRGCEMYLKVIWRREKHKNMVRIRTGLGSSPESYAWVCCSRCVTWILHGTPVWPGLPSRWPSTMGTTLLTS